MYREKIKEIAFKLFRAWTKNAAIYYPEMDFTIDDETNLVNDLEQAILKGIKALQKEGEKKERKQSGFDYGFVIGFVQGNLDVSWIHEYVNKNTESYRDFMACKSILEYLRFDTEIGVRINRLYKGIMKEDTNLADINITINEKDIEKYELNKASKEKQYFEKHSPVYMYLENQLSKHIVDVMDCNNKNIMPELRPYFKPEFITELVLTYEK